MSLLFLLAIFCTLSTAFNVTITAVPGKDLGQQEPGWGSNQFEKFPFAPYLSCSTSTSTPCQCYQAEQVNQPVKCYYQSVPGGAVLDMAWQLVYDWNDARQPTKVLYTFTFSYNMTSKAAQVIYPQRQRDRFWNKPCVLSQPGKYSCNDDPFGSYPTSFPFQLVTVQ